MIHTDSLFQTTIWFVMELWISACRSYLMLEIPSVVKRLMLGIFYVLFLVSPIFFFVWGRGGGIVQMTFHLFIHSSGDFIFLTFVYHAAL